MQILVSSGDVRRGCVAGRTCDGTLRTESGWEKMIGSSILLLLDFSTMVKMEPCIFS